LTDARSHIQALASAARRHIDLSVQVMSGAPPRLEVRNRFSEALRETILCSDKGAFVTSYGYRIGTAADVDAAATRLAYLMTALPA